jgi:hypothetical protein
LADVLGSIEAETVEPKLCHGPVHPVQESLLHERVTLVQVDKRWSQPAILGGEGVLLRRKKRLAKLGGSTGGIAIAGCLEFYFDSSTVRNMYELCPLENRVDVCMKI